MMQKADHYAKKGLDMQMRKILFVCTGNTCRSPMAAYLLRDMLQKQGVSQQVLVESAGLAAYAGDPISDHAASALRERGIHADAHRAKPLNPLLLEQADLIYVMTEAHKQAIVQAMPETAGKIRVLHISDPYGLDITAYRACLDELEHILQEQLPEILSGKDGGAQ